MLHEIEQHAKRGFVPDAVGEIDGGILKVGGDAALTDTFRDR